MCPANGELENADPESPVDFLCEIAHLRVMALGEEVPGHGNCECCAGGKSYEELKQLAAELPAIMEQLPVPDRVLLPVLSAGGSSCQSGGCSH
jgi:hypothetical protein